MDPISLTAMTGLSGKVSGAPSSKIDPAAGADSDDLKLKDLCRSFESFFLAELLKGSGMLKESDTPGSEVYGPMAVEALAGQIAKSGGIGFADLIYRALKDETGGR